MNTRATVVVSGLFALLALGVIAQGVRISKLQNDLVQAHDRIDKIKNRQKKVVPATSPSVEEIREEIREEIARVERKVDARPVARNADSTGALDNTVTEDYIAQIVEEQLREQTGEKAKPNEEGEEQGAFGERKLPLSNIAKDLDLDTGTEAVVAEIANVVKREIFDILKTPRADGSNLADDLVDGFLSGDEKKIRESFGKVFTEVLPGSNTTYLAAMGAAQERAHQSLENSLGEDRYMRFKHMNVDPNNIQTGYDPFEEYIQQRGQ